MTNQMFPNHQGWQDFGQERRRDLMREAERERQISQLPQSARPNRPAYYALVPIGIALTVLIGATLALV